MIFRTDMRLASGSREYPLETVRALAVVLLVSYHVIGSGSGAGLHLAYPQIGRVLADAFVDVRMPLFGFIAGYVYALRPVAPGQYVSFLTGKFHRLYVPGIIAALLFASVTTTMKPQEGLTVSTLWRVFILPYAHYWFLQAILVIFVVFGGLDSIFRHRGTVVILAASVLAYFYFPRATPNLMSVNQAVYLFPYFMFGVVFLRYKSLIDSHAIGIVIVALVVILLGAWWNLQVLEKTGKLSLVRHDLHSLSTGLSVCAVLLLTLPRVRAVEVIGPFAFTIYLYHVFGTAGMRDVLQALGITQVSVLFIASLIAGISLPIVLHLVSDRFSFTRRFVLGRRH